MVNGMVWQETRDQRQGKQDKTPLVTTDEDERNKKRLFEIDHVVYVQG